MRSSEGCSWDEERGRGDYAGGVEEKKLKERKKEIWEGDDDLKESGFDHDTSDLRKRKKNEVSSRRESRGMKGRSERRLTW